MIQGIPADKKIVYDTLDFSIDIGGTALAKNAELREGECIGVKLVDYSSATARNHKIGVSVLFSNGTDIIGTTDYRDYITSGAGYLGSYKPCSFSIKNPKVQITSDTAIADAAFSGQMIFAILQDK